ncbi:uncharacterized protein LOC143191377 isoform X4 [Rhynchophorus ferrugineus]|uniref:uncharacterized protein LOC143191377 isoform X4 n=1 Tax=Rhynchophorus ferrugineus TaxID=354439 RepID=UPI003FCDA92D
MMSPKMSRTVGPHATGSLNLMSCVRESSPLQDYEADVDKNVVSKRKFWNPKKWFRKKQKTSDEHMTHGSHIPHSQQEHRDVEGARSRSTDELSTDEEPSRSNEVRNSSSMHPGLSVSHDSVFHPLNSSDLELDGAQSSSSLSISQPLGDSKLQTELSSRLQLRRGRGDTSEDDEGLPRSPPCGSPAAATDSFLILEKAVNKDLPCKSHSTCSDGSLLSMDGSEMEEDSIGLPSRNSSKVSLNEKKPELDIELGPTSLSVPLNHSAAHHRVSVRPKRTYGAPRRKKGQIATALPATPEVNEESSIRSISPESITTEPIIELYSSTSRTSALTNPPRPDIKLKCNSLPAGVTPPTGDSFRLSRSRSNAGKSQDDAALPVQEKEEKLSLFDRLFPRRSGKKKKKEEKVMERNTIMEVDSGSAKRTSDEKVVHTQPIPVTVSKAQPETRPRTSHTYAKREEVKPTVVPRTGAASRQRIQPIDIPSSPTSPRESSSVEPISPVTPERLYHARTSPIQLELENVLKQRQIQHSNVKETVRDVTTHTSSSITTTTKEHSEIKSIVVEETKSRAKFAALSSLQQRVLNLSSAVEEDQLPPSVEIAIPKPKKTISKSYSFKNQSEKLIVLDGDRLSADSSKTVTKSSSLDSIKNLDEPKLKSELQMILKPVQKLCDKVDKPPEVETQNNEIITVNNKSVTESALKEAERTQVHSEQSSSTYTYNTSSSNTFEEHSVQTNKEPVLLPFNDAITISGPSHTAIVNVTSQADNINHNTITSETECVENEGIKSIVHKESQISVTKIHLKQKSTEIIRTSVTVPKENVPEFLNKQLNKVEQRSASNIILTMKPDEVEQSKTKTTSGDDLERPQLLPRKFSKEDVEIIERDGDSECSKDVSPPKTPTLVPVTPTTPNQNRFRKNDSKPSSRKSSIISITPESPVRDHLKDRALKARSISLDSLKTDQNGNDPSTGAADKSSQDSLDKLDRRTGDGVILRRKSLVKHKNEEEPELMKVFARRSLKLKDGDVEQIQESIAEEKLRESNKENVKDATGEDPQKKKEDCSMQNKLIKSSFNDSKKSTESLRTSGEESDVHLRRSISNNVFLSSHRAVSLNLAKPQPTHELSIRKQPSLNERRRTDWQSVKEQNYSEKRAESETITTISTNSDIPTKNFSQRKAEWEKRVQQAQK